MYNRTRNKAQQDFTRAAKTYNGSMKIAGENTSNIADANANSS